jgi:C-terminal binding protein
VCNIPDYGTEEVADSAISHILNMYRGTHTLCMKVANGETIQGADGISAACGPTVTRVRGTTLGLVGMGRIGTATALRAKAFGFDVVFFDPALPDGTHKALGVRRVETLAELMAQSKCVSLHCNCTAENTRMIDAEALSHLTPGAFFVNTARGELVDDEALAAALTSGRLALACLDVHWGEPFVVGKGTSPLTQLPALPNLICSPHSAWFSNESRHEMRVKGAQTARKALLGQPLRNVVNQQYLK